MKETALALNDPGSSLAEWVSRARREGSTIVVHDASGPLARLVPAPSCTGAQLAAALKKVALAPEEAAEWREDCRQSHASILVRFPVSAS